MNAVRVCLIALSFLSLSACNDPRIDASSDQALQASLDGLYLQLPPTDGEALRQGINALNEYYQKRVYKGEPVDDAQRDYLDTLNGKTVKEVGKEVARLTSFNISSEYKITN